MQYSYRFLDLQAMPHSLEQTSIDLTGVYTLTSSDSSIAFSRSSRKMSKFLLIKKTKSFLPLWCIDAWETSTTLEQLFENWENYLCMTCMEVSHNEVRSLELCHWLLHKGNDTVQLPPYHNSLHLHIHHANYHESCGVRKKSLFLNQTPWVWEAMVGRPNQVWSSVGSLDLTSCLQRSSSPSRMDLTLMYAKMQSDKWLEIALCLQVQSWDLLQKPT